MISQDGERAVSGSIFLIFALSAQRDESGLTVRHSILDLANELSSALDSTPTVSFSGPVDLIVTGELADDVLAVAREALVNIVKHAGATHASVELHVRNGSVFLEVKDDGHGLADTDRRSGIANLEERAVLRGGTFALESDSAGTRLLWQVPYSTVPA